MSLRSSKVDGMEDNSGLVSVDDEHFLPSPYLRPTQGNGWDKSGSSRHIWSSTQPESLAMSSICSSSWERTYSSSRVQLAEQALIGKGSSGKVYRAMDRETNRLIAVKEIPLGNLPTLASQSSFSGSPHSRRRSSLTIFVTEQGLAAHAELDVLRQLDHPNIVKYLGEETDLDAGCIRIYMDLVSGGSIRSLLTTYGKLQERQAASFTRQVLDGLVYLHSKHIVHRDLKGDNLLVEPSGVLKLADFGTAGVVSALAYSKETGGTAFFMSPEVLTNEKVISEKADIWSVGCCVLEMMAGKPPLVNLHSQYAIMMMIAESKGELLHHYLPAESNTWSAELQDFLRCCLRRNPEERPSAEELLHHPWISSSTSSAQGSSSNDVRPHYPHNRFSASNSQPSARGETTQSSQRGAQNPTGTTLLPEDSTGLTSSSARQHRSSSSRNTSARPTKLDWNWEEEEDRTTTRIPDLASSRSYTAGGNRGKHSPSTSSLFLGEEGEDGAQYLDVTYPQRSKPTQRDDPRRYKGSTSEKRRNRRDNVERRRQPAPSRRDVADDDDDDDRAEYVISKNKNTQRVCPRWVNESLREKDSSSSSKTGYDVFPSLSPRGKKVEHLR